MKTRAPDGHELALLAGTLTCIYAIRFGYRFIALRRSETHRQSLFHKMDPRLWLE